MYVFLSHLACCTSPIHAEHLRGALTLWNFPSAMITRKLGLALAAGCMVVLKPTPETPFSALALAKLVWHASVSAGVLNIVMTLENVKEVGSELCENKIVKKVTFTGSMTIAKLLYKQAAGSMKKLAFSFDA